MKLRLRVRGFDLSRGFPEAGFGASVDNDACAFSGERLCNCKTDARSGAGDEGEFTGDLEVHVYT